MPERVIAAASPNPAVRGLGWSLTGQESVQEVLTTSKGVYFVTATNQAQSHAWGSELAAHLAPRCFPATHDDLAALLLRQHAPSRLVWYLSVLPRQRRFDTLEELLDWLDAYRPTAVDTDPA